MKTTTDYASKYADNVKKQLKKGKKGKIKSFFKDVIKLYEDQIDYLERENKDIEGEFGKLADAKEKKLNYAFDININRLSNVDERRGYATEFANNLLQFDRNEIKPLEEELEINKKQIQILKDTIEFLKTAEPIVDEEDDETVNE
jgi:prefoldin subunit 5